MNPPSSPPPDARGGACADPRRTLVRQWLAQRPAGLELLPDTLRPASADASFRRYFRVDSATLGGSLIVMDAPPDKEDVGRFARIATLLREGGLSVPRVLAGDIDQGLLLLGDLGQTTYLDALLRARQAGEHAACDSWMRDALHALVRLQGLRAQLPAYDRQRLLAEMDLFPQWYVQRHLGAELAAGESQGLQQVFEVLLGCALAQPVVCVHRDYHSRNLMLLQPGQELGNPGILDFQDAVLGPITYDLVSLLRDAYIAWPEEQQIDWAVRYWEAARGAGLPVDADFGQFYRDFEFMGLQRQLKVLGIFARLHHRDGKAQYLGDLPQVLAYASAVAARYREFAPLRRLLERLQGVQVRHGYTF